MEQLQRVVSNLPFRIRPMGLLRELGFGRVIDLYRRARSPQHIDQETILRTLRRGGPIGRDRQPRRVGDYSLRQILGRGRAGTVYRAWDEAEQAPVAVKVLSKAAGPHPQELSHAALPLAELRHPNLVQVSQEQRDGDQGFLVMPLAERGTLAQWLARAGRPLDPTFTARVVSGLASALQYLHDRGMAHLDVKPANVLMSDSGWPLLADFSSALPFGVAEQGSRRRKLGGTPAYMSPEQARGGPLDARSDQYSLALLAQEMLTACRPAESSPVATISTIPPPLKVVLARALAPNAADRYANVESFGAAFKGAVDHFRADASTTSTLIGGILLLAAFCLLLSGALAVGGGMPSSSYDLFWSLLAVAATDLLYHRTAPFGRAWAAAFAAHMVLAGGSVQERDRLSQAAIAVNDLVYALVAGAFLCRALFTGLLLLALEPAHAAVLTSAVIGTTWVVLAAAVYRRGGLTTIPFVLLFSLALSLALPAFDPALSGATASVPVLFRLGLGAEIAISLLLLYRRFRIAGMQAVAPWWDRAVYGTNLPQQEAEAAYRTGRFAAITGLAIDAGLVVLCAMVVGVPLIVLLTS